MKLQKRLLIIGLLAALLLALPVSVFAGRKQIFKARMTQDQVVPYAQLAAPRGVGILGLSPGGIHFEVGAHNLPDSDQTGANLLVGGGDISVTIHGRAMAGQTAPAVVYLCGGPSITSGNQCNVFDGHLKIFGTIAKEQFVGMSPKDFIDAMQDEELYIQVNVDGSPLIRGQLYELD